MKTVLLTGSGGFIGRNLRAHLSRRDDIRLLCIDVENPREDLLAAVREADFVIHLAGINRPKDPTEFVSGNVGFTQDLIELLSARDEKIPLLISSSIQAAVDNPYGSSKLGAENSVRKYAISTAASVFVFRLPNVFGKWCRPNYNSVVATWCHNTAHGLPIQINDPEATLTLVYVDDVCEAFIAALDGALVPDEDGFCRVGRSYVTTLAELSEMLDSFVASRKNLVMPSLANEFTVALYATWLSYLPIDDFSYPLVMKRDARGWLAEFIKSPEFGQIFVSRTQPGITRGNHWHHTKVEKFLVLSGQALIRFRKIDDDRILEYPVSGDELRVVDICVGYFDHILVHIGQNNDYTLNEVFIFRKALQRSAIYDLRSYPKNA